MLNFIEKFLSLPKSLYVSFRLFPFNEAIKCPCLVRYNTKLISLDGTIKVKWGGGKTIHVLCWIWTSGYI